MEFKSYVDEDAGEKSFRSVADDGRRVEEKSSTSQLPDGSIQEVHEIHEEVIPMRLTKRTSIKKAFVPVEEKTEVVASDGTVNTNVKSLYSNLTEMPVINTAPKNVSPNTFEGTFSKMAATKYAGDAPVAQTNVPFIVTAGVAAVVVAFVVYFLTFGFN